jgi:hypothetical protein
MSNTGSIRDDLYWTSRGEQFRTDTGKVLQQKGSSGPLVEAINFKTINFVFHYFISVFRIVSQGLFLSVMVERKTS